MIGYIDAFKKMNLLMGRSSCSESINWMLSLYDSDSIDLNEAYRLAMDSENPDVPNEWQSDAKRYVKSHLALKEACRYNNVSIVESPRFRITLDGNTSELKTLSGVYKRREKIVNEFAENYYQDVKYTTNKNGAIEKIEKEQILYLDEQTEVVIVDSKNNLYRASNKYQVDEQLKEIKKYAKSLMMHRITLERHLTDPSGLFDVWVKVNKE